MAIVPEQTLQVPETSIVSLAAYARHVQVCECSMFGVVGNADCVPSADCRTIWTKDQRDWIQYYLAEAQYEIEEVLNYTIGRRWQTDEEHDYEWPIIADWGYVISGGVRTVTTITAGQAVSHVDDPATVGPFATTVTDPREIKVYHPGSDIEIIPSAITISGGAMTISIPRCRMVKPELVDNSTAGIAYDDVNNFSATADVVRVYNVDNNPAELVFQQCQTRTSCTETTQDACIYVRKPLIGSVLVRADCITACGRLYKARLNYYAGREYADENGYLTSWGRQAQDAIIRLAHAKMPSEPCGCDAANRMWERDRMVVVDSLGRPNRGISLFGPEEGAWAAYNFAKAPGMQLYRSAVL